MAIVTTTALESNKNIRVNFDGGNLFSDGGLLLIKEFYHKLGVDTLLKRNFHTNDPASFRIHKDHENLLQMLYQITAAYFQDDHADSLRKDPVMNAVIGKSSLASQPTLSRFHNRMDEQSLKQLEEIQRILRKRVYSVEKPEHILFDLDSTLTSYVIRLKENPVLRRLAKDLDSELHDLTLEDPTSYAVVYGEFLYKAGSWDYPRRVVCKIEKPYGQMIHMNTFVVTNMESSPEDLIRFYCKRGQMENFIKECKSGFDMSYVSSSSMIVNANRVQIHALAYNLFNWFRRLILPETMRKDRIDTVRLKLLKIAARIVTSARYVYFKLCSHCPYQSQFFETLANISRLQPIHSR